MANYKKKNQGLAGLIFIWVLVILLAFGAFWVIRHYNLNNSTIISNDQLAETLALALDTHAGKLTEEDIASIEGISYADYGTASEILLYLPGYNAAYEAYYAEDVTDEQKKELTDPSSLIAYTTLSETDIYSDLHLFKGITAFNFINGTDKMNENDVLTIAAENSPNLNSFSVRSYVVNDFSVVKNLPKLETLVIYDSALSDISAISELKNLKYLDLSETGLTDISPLSSLDNETIEVVYLTGNPITDWSPVSHLDQDKVIKEIESDESSEETDAETETETDTEADTEATTEETAE